MARNVDLVAGARPNFMKIAPLHRALTSAGAYRVRFVHTGQHYDAELSDVVLRDLGLPAPDVHLGAGSGTHSEQTAAVMIAYERVCLEHRPDCCIVVGDVNSTMAAALVAAKLDIRLAHLEAGLRSRDRTMPEEINRIVTDRLADLLWAPSADAVSNLLTEGNIPESVEMVGNIMIDAFEMLHDPIYARASPLPLEPGYGIVTLHRPGNVDDPRILEHVTRSLISISARLPLLFPVHPRTQARLREMTLWDELESAPGMYLTPPQGYIEFMGNVVRSSLVITDSGGIQEETTYLGIPCLTLRQNTERPITVTSGTNRLVGPADLTQEIERVLAAPRRENSPPPLWDGQTAGRVVDSLHRFLQGQKAPPN